MKKKKTQRARKRLVLSLMLIALAITAWGSTDVTTTINGVNVTVTVLDGWNVEDIDNTTGTSGDFNRPFPLKKDNYYYFGKATVGEYAIRTVLWDKFENVTLTIGNEKVTGVVLKFKGIDGYYRIRKVSELTKRDGTDDAKFDNTTFLRVVPLKKNFATDNSIDWDNLKNSNRTAKFQDRDTAFPNFSKDNDKDSDWGYGCLYIAGGPGFGYGEYDKYVGWDKRWMPDGYDQNYTLIDNQMWIPSPEKNLYKFRLQAGGNISNDPNKAFNVKFYLNNYMKKFTGDNYDTQSMDWTKYDLVNSWRGDRGTNNGTPVDSYPYLMHLKDGRDCFYISGNVPGTENDEQKNSPDWNNGNFRTTTIGFDSDMPAMPEGYTFEITLDLRNTKTGNWAKLNTDGDGRNGIMVDIEQVKSDIDVMYKYVNPDYMKVLNKNAIEQIGYDDEKKMVELYLGYYGRGENADDVTIKQGKRIKLRDALRLDYGIRYANQYNKDGILDSIKKYDKMIIHGILSVDDMEYISWLCNYNLLKELDLRDAVLPGNIIPAPSTIDGIINSKSKAPFDFGGASTSLKKVIMPTNGVSGIGKNAFKGCTSLENVAEIVKNTKGYIGESAFEECTNENFTKLDVPETITTIGSRAFADDKQLTEVTVPASFNGTLTDPWDTNIVGEKYKGHTVAGKINAWEFNKDFELGYSSVTNGSSHTSTWRPDDNGKVDIWNVANKNGSYRPIVDTRANNFFNYTFNCTEDGTYKITFNAGIYKGDNSITTTPVKIDAYIDGLSIGSVTILNKSESWDYCDQPESLENVMIGKGTHVFKIVTVDGHVNIDNFNFEKTGGNYVAPQKSHVIPSCTNKDTFEGVPANNCEVKFTGDDDSNNYAEYRKQDGWMYLLTKDLDEDKAYSCVNQQHADIKMTRSFLAYTDRNQLHSNWYSVVFPFAVDAKTLINARTDDGKYVFDRAAYLDNKSFNRDGYPNVHFSYLNGTPFLAKVNFEGYPEEVVGISNRTYEIGDNVNGTTAAYKLENNERIADTNNGDKIIAAGVPFIVRIDANDKSNAQIFKNINFTDIRVYPSDDKENGKQTSGDYGWNYNLTTSVAKEDNSALYSFVGNLYDAPVSIENENIYFLSGKWYHGGNVNKTLKTIRSYFMPNSAEGASLVKKLVAGGTTAIISIQAEREANEYIYNLNGQIVRKGNSLDGLAKGIYVVNGKRVIIK